jgi:hypothetical protein
MWDQLLTWLHSEGSTLLVFDVEDPAEVTIRSGRIGFYQGNGARLLPVRGYQTPHGTADQPGWSPMLLMAAPVEAGARAPGPAEEPAIVSAVYQHRWRLEPGHTRVRATQVVAADSCSLARE